MTLEAIADIQARIATIQSRFDDAAATTASATASATAAGGASSSTAPAWATNAASGASFADMLATLQTSDLDPSASTSSSGADGLGSAGGLSGLAGVSGLTGSDGLSGLSGLSGVNGLSGLTGLGGIDGLTGTGGSAGAPGFAATALSQAGKQYVYGATASPSDPNPQAFDCSELVQWAAARNGVTMPRTAGQQYATLAAQGDAITVQQALHTPGALLFEFSNTPTVGGAEPSHAHVAISLGDGRTIEARGRAYGVGVFQAGNRFQYAAVVPGLS